VTREAPDTEAVRHGGAGVETLAPDVVARAPILWNPSAGEKAGVRLGRMTRDELQAILVRHGLAGPLYETRSTEDAIGRVDRFVEAGAQLIVAAGGDGTVSAIASHLIGSDVAVGILPLGSLMNVARSLGVPRDPVAAAAIIREGRVTRIDAARAADRVFFEVASVGLSAALMRESQRVSRGQFGAVVQAVRVLARYHATDFELELDDRTERVRGLVVSVANAPYTGFNMTFAPNARIDDGLLDVVVFGGYSRSEFVLHALSIVAGRRAASPRLSTYRARRVTVTSTRPLPCRADASDCGTTPVTVESIPQAVRFVVPARPGAAVAWGAGPSDVSG
jgi:YegS/Rv2252/BmrU family lipid kinase